MWPPHPATCPSHGLSSPLCGDQARSREASRYPQGEQSPAREPHGICLPLVTPQSLPELAWAEARIWGCESQGSVSSAHYIILCEMRWEGPELAHSPVHSAIFGVF